MIVKLHTPAIGDVAPLRSVIGKRGKRRSPKTLANARGILSAALKEHGINVSPTIPSKQKQMRELLTPQQIYAATRGSNVELPVLLAMWLSLSMSEIRGLTVSDVKEGRVYIRHVAVDAEKTTYERETVKVYERARKLDVPEYLLGLIENTEAWKRGGGHLV